MARFFRLYKNDEQALYIQAADGLRLQILDGVFRPGDKLPSVRRLSDELGVNPATIVAAYRILANEGLIESRAGSGVFVSALGKPGVLSGPECPDAAANALHDKVPQLYDLASNSPARSLYPLDDMKRFLVEAIDMDGGKAFDYQNSPGYQPLKTVLSERLSQANNCSILAGDVHIVSGAQQGLDLAARLLLRRGDVAIVESPGYRGARDAFLAAGARIVPLSMGKNGADLDMLEAIAARQPVRLVYVNPQFQNPSSQSYSHDAMERLASLAVRYGFYVLEDDQLSELAYDAEAKKGRPLSVRAYDKAERVVFVKSFSKTLMPGLRIACLEAPRIFREGIESIKRSIDINSSGLMQRVLERFLSTGRHDERLVPLRAHYKNAASIFIAALEPYRHRGFDWDEPGGGLNLWLRLPDGCSGTALASGLAASGCSVVPEALFRFEKGFLADRHVRLSFGSTEPEKLQAAARLVAEKSLELL